MAVTGRFLGFLAKHAVRIVSILYGVVLLREEAWLSFAAAVLLTACLMLERRHVPWLTAKKRVALCLLFFFVSIILSPGMRSA